MEVDWSWVQGDTAAAIAGSFALLATLVSARNIYAHLQFPATLFRRVIIRIQLIVPLYAITSFISLRYQRIALYLDIGVRDLYEAYIVYLFVTLVVALCGGPSRCATDLARRPAMKHPVPLCCLPRLTLGAKFLQRMKQMTLQFVVMKPLMAVFSLAALAVDLYFSSGFQSVLLVVYNASYTIALYGLLLMYLAARHLISHHNVGKKFLSVKLVVFMTYWQGLVVMEFSSSDPVIAEQWDDFVLCIEMLAFALLHRRAFPADEFADQERRGKGLTVIKRMLEAVSLRDMWNDTRDSFSSRPILLDEYRGVALIDTSDIEFHEEADGVETAML